MSIKELDPNAIYYDPKETKDRAMNTTDARWQVFYVCHAIKVLKKVTLIRIFFGAHKRRGALQYTLKHIKHLEFLISYSNC